MSEKVTLDLPEGLARQLRAVAANSRRRFEDVVMEYIERGADQASVEFLPDADLLALCDAQMEEADQEELANLQGMRREGPLSPHDSQRLEYLLDTYRRGLVRKAKALQAAVGRGIRAPLG